jgi:transcriptional regulator with XRE-family HTH domain
MKEINLGYVLTLRRAMLGLSRAQAAEAAGISYPFYSELEKNKKVASWETLQGLARAMRFASLSEFARFAEDATASRP